MPTPGLIDRLPDSSQGDVPGMGPEDFEVNHTAALYSVMVGLNLFSPDLLVGPTEKNELVVEYASYDHSAFDPTTLAIAMSSSPDRADSAETSSSGCEVPSPTMTAPMSTALMPMLRETRTALVTSRSEAKTRSARPPTT